MNRSYSECVHVDIIIHCLYTHFSAATEVANCEVMSWFLPQNTGPMFVTRLTEIQRTRITIITVDYSTTVAMA